MKLHYKLVEIINGIFKSLTSCNSSANYKVVMSYFLPQVLSCIRVSLITFLNERVEK